MNLNLRLFCYLSFKLRNVKASIDIALWQKLYDCEKKFYIIIVFPENIL